MIHSGRLGLYHMDGDYSFSCFNSLSPKHIPKCTKLQVEFSIVCTLSKEFFNLRQEETNIKHEIICDFCHFLFKLNTGMKKKNKAYWCHWVNQSSLIACWAIWITRIKALLNWLQDTQIQLLLVPQKFWGTKSNWIWGPEPTYLGNCCPHAVLGVY